MRLGLSGERLARLDEEIYEREIREHMEDAHRGDIVAIDVAGRAWAVGEAVLGSAECLREHTGPSGVKPPLAAAAAESPSAR